MTVSLSPEVKQLIDRTNFAHLATLMPDGSPSATPVWIGREGERLVICTGGNSLKAKNTKHDPRIAVSIIDFTNPYEEAQIRGRVVEWRAEPELKTLDSFSRRYTGKPFPFRSSDQIALIIEVEKERYAKLPFEHTPPK
jgi:PPOX class probable F420-dependent enzyme